MVKRVTLTTNVATRMLLLLCVTGDAGLPSDLTADEMDESFASLFTCIV